MRKLMWATAATVLVAGPAAAFYFPGWPADGLPRLPTLYATTVGGFPPGPQTDFLLSRAPARVASQTVPEPSGLVLAALGLAALVMRRGERPA